MSVTVKQALNLPSLRQAQLVAGFGSLERPITAVTVLEPACPAPESDAFAGGEMMLTSFSTMTEDVDAQCQVLRTLAQSGQSALVIFYLGIVLPTLPEALVQLAKELDFPLLVMPGEARFRYSGVIRDVMQAIFQDQLDESHLLGDLVDHMTLLPANQQTVDTVLQLISDRVRATLLLLDEQDQVMAAVAWPRGTQMDTSDLLLRAKQGNAEHCAFMKITAPEHQMYQLYLLKEGQPLSSEVLQQIQDIMTIAVSRWNVQHAELALEELLRAIVKDEPVKMRRMASLFRLHMESIHCMWLLTCPSASQREEFMRLSPTIANELLKPHCQTVVAGAYQDFVVVLADNGIFGPTGQELLAELQERLRQEGISSVSSSCQGLQTTAQVRQAFLRTAEAMPSAACIWPLRSSYTQGEIDYALYCKNQLLSDEQAIKLHRATLAPLHAPGDDFTLIETLAVYLLDAQQSISHCAQLLFLHKNTVKYRYQQINHRLGYPPDKLPEMNSLYQSVALYRLLKNQPSFN
ncbi:MAG: PucR family transcriptional regulator ligand-binding domain-containing protein [Candidatus Fournierella pullistercoris]|uniref:PucR family transcriptional regulator ligand-binding domain-containing protein n=1 Tax=Candidatus Allofournierella pullistercoris TaxID=2838597 RepID=A0A948T2Z0_9FIRM|nr:PucR family transcriptional regulator ligand-binding domain-containing protein [Candidatus Fournierella pullistercoris]